MSPPQRFKSSHDRANVFLRLCRQDARCRLLLGSGESRLLFGLAVYAHALVEYVCAEERHAVKIAGGQAGCGANRAVHVFDLAAAYAEGVVVVVARSGFVEGGVPGGSNLRSRSISVRSARIT